MNTKLKRFLDGYIKSNSKFDLANVFPLMCGVGKTTYLRYLISDALHERFGLIIITDRLDNLNSITTSNVDDGFNRLVHDNADKIAMLSSDNIKAELPSLHKKPIVLMSTQRYFNLDIDTIKGLTKTRTKIVFDEKPLVLECRKIDIKALNDIDTALKQGLNNTVSQCDKNYLTDAFADINFKLQSILKENETKNTGYKLERVIQSEELLFDETEFDKFFTAVGSYKSNIANCDLRAVKTIVAIKKLLSEGGIVVSEKKLKKKSDKNYDNYFLVVVNNAEKLTAVGANVFVLDGTGDISPEYSLDCFNVVDCSGFQRDLSKLNLRIVELNTSKTKLTTAGAKTDKYISRIMDYIRAEPERYNVLFTYKVIEDKFAKYFTTEHFGNIKGTNAFRTEQNIAQVGISVLPHSVYFLIAGEIVKYNHHNDLTNIVSDYNTVDEVMCRFIMADLEQNIFRGCIRDEANQATMNYMLFCNYDYLSTLTDRHSMLQQVVDGKKLKRMIYNRYSRLDAKINFIEMPMEFKLFKLEERQQDTNTRRVLDWLSTQGKGYTFEIEDMLNNLSLSQKQFQKIKYINPSIKELFNKMRLSKGLYKII